MQTTVDTKLQGSCKSSCRAPNMPDLLPRRVRAPRRKRPQITMTAQFGPLVKWLPLSSCTSRSCLFFSFRLWALWKKESCFPVSPRGSNTFPNMVSAQKSSLPLSTCSPFYSSLYTCSFKTIPTPRGSAHWLLNPGCRHRESALSGLILVQINYVILMQGTEIHL